MVFGVTIPFFGTGLSGLWLAFIGWFLSNASVQSYHQVVIQDVLEGVAVSRVMRDDPPTVSPDLTVDELVDRHVLGTDDHSFPVMKEGSLKGIVTLEDIRSVSKGDRSQVKVAEIMTPFDQLTVAAPDDDVSDVLELIKESDFRQVPVLEGSSLKGILRRRDILRWLQIHADEQKGISRLKKAGATE